MQRSITSLYVPGDRPDRFDKAAQSGAHAIILDLEDAVAESSKSAARANVAEWLAATPGAPAWIRVNNRPDLLADDLAMAESVDCLGVVMAKAEPAACAATTLDVVALVESAAGVATMAEIAHVDNVVRLALGEADLAADLGFDPSPDGREFWAIRSDMVVASTVAGLSAPVGPVPTDLDDDDALTQTSEQLLRQGFGGRSIIHPKQIAAVHAAFQPSDDELAWARSIVAAYDRAADDASGVAVVDGEFVDAAVLRRAHNTIARTGSA